MSGFDFVHFHRFVAFCRARSLHKRRNHETASHLPTPGFDTPNTPTGVTNLRAWFIAAPLILIAAGISSCISPPSGAAPGVHDPGVRGGPAGAGDPLPGLTADETAFFNDGRARFLEVDAVKDGLGPRFNSNSCVSCHSQPDAGGTSPSRNANVGLWFVYG